MDTFRLSLILRALLDTRKREVIRAEKRYELRKQKKKKA